MSNNHKGIVLAGGSGTRLNPITLGTSKQLLPIYDKPMIYYPISVLMLSNIRDILVISSPQDISNYKRLLGDGSQFGISIQYAIQEVPNGLAKAFVIGEEFIGNSNVALVLGDNIFYGQNFEQKLESASLNKDGAVIFGYKVNNPEQFGIVELGQNGTVMSLEEKPKNPKSNYAVVGLYFYDNTVIEISKSLKPSLRGEYEITDINNIYNDRQSLKVELLEGEFTWLDTGTYDSLIDAGQFVRKIQNRQKSLNIGCLEEIAFNKKWISIESVRSQIEQFKKTSYGEYLKKVINNQV